MLQLYPPYKNLVPEIPKVGKEKVTRTTPVFNELVDTTPIFFVDEVHPRHLVFLENLATLPWWQLLQIYIRTYLSPKE
jgi:hypothetical protein